MRYPTDPAQVLVFPMFFLGVFLLSASTSHAVPPTATSPFALHDLTLTYGDQTESVPTDILSKWVTLTPRTSFQESYQSEIENTHFCPIGRTPYCELIFSRSERFRIKSTVTLAINETEIRSWLKNLNTTKVASAPSDPQFTVTDGKVSTFAQGTDGRTLDTEKSLENIRAALLHGDGRSGLTVPLAINTVPASAGATDAASLGILTQISEGRTNFSSSPRNRIHNFTLGAQQFNGVLIKPGEEFSFIKQLGPVDGEHGYLPELVIKQNETTPEFGGGICQVSTTAFRAALNAGLKITMRHNHAYPVQYYKPYGMDATVYIPLPDLRFINNTPGYILIQTAIEGNELVFRFYGTDDGRHTSIDGPHILSAPGDGSMKTIFTQTVTDAQGNTIIDEKFPSNYKPASQFPHPGATPVPDPKKH